MLNFCPAQAVCCYWDVSGMKCCYNWKILVGFAPESDAHLISPSLSLYKLIIQWMKLSQRKYDKTALIGRERRGRTTTGEHRPHRLPTNKQYLMHWLSGKKRMRLCVFILSYFLKSLDGFSKSEPALNGACSAVLIPTVRSGNNWWPAEFRDERLTSQHNRTRPAPLTNVTWSSIDNRPFH